MNYSLLIVALVALFFSNANAQDTLANSGFEIWTNQGTYEDLADWNTLNPLSSALGVYTATKTTGAEAHSGSYGLKLQSKSLLGTIRPGVLTTGTINVANSTIGGGVAISSRPLYLNGWYQYWPAGADTALFSITLTKWDATGDSQIVVGSGSFTQMDRITSWSQFSVTIDYNTTDVPDTALIIITSGSDVASTINSALLLDDVDFANTAVGIISPSNIEPLSIYPNPANGFVLLNSASSQHFNLFSLEGKLVLSTDLIEGLNRIDLEGISKGLYVVSTIDAKGNARYGKLLVE